MEELTQWITKLGRGDPAAAQAVWERYFGKLVLYARRKLECLPRRAADEEDVALSAMQSFCRNAAEHRCDWVADGEDLWKLLVTITARKVSALRRRQFAAKRGGMVRGESAFLGRQAGEGRDEGIGAVLGEEPTPELAAMVAEDCREMLDRLGDETLRQVALYTLEGYSPPEIAEKLACVRRTVERKLERIREKWAREMPT